jgi:ankyrin repeat protein
MEIIMALMQQGDVDVNSKLLFIGDLTAKRSLLSTAASRGKGDAVKFLLRLEGIDIDSKDEWGMTACTWARRNGHEDIVSLFEDHDLQRKLPSTEKSSRNVSL